MIEMAVDLFGGEVCLTADLAGHLFYYYLLDFLLSFYLSTAITEIFVVGRNLI